MTFTNIKYGALGSRSALATNTYDKILLSEIGALVTTLAAATFSLPLSLISSMRQRRMYNLATFLTLAVGHLRRGLYSPCGHRIIAIQLRAGLEADQLQVYF